MYSKDRGPASATIRYGLPVGTLPRRVEAEYSRVLTNGFGKFDWAGVITRLNGECPAVSSYDRLITTPSHHAYIKIAEGCNRFCAFSRIPLITGRFKSRPVDEILSEVSDLVARGVKEFNVIAQDLSSYGTDFSEGRYALPELIDAWPISPEWSG